MISRTGESPNSMQELFQQQIDRNEARNAQGQSFADLLASTSSAGAAYAAGRSVASVTAGGVTRQPLPSDTLPTVDTSDSAPDTVAPTRNPTAGEVYAKSGIGSFLRGLGDKAKGLLAVAGLSDLKPKLDALSDRIFGGLADLPPDQAVGQVPGRLDEASRELSSLAQTDVNPLGRALLNGFSEAASAISAYVSSRNHDSLEALIQDASLKTLLGESLARVTSGLAQAEQDNSADQSSRTSDDPGDQQVATDSPGEASPTNPSRSGA